LATSSSILSTISPCNAHTSRHGEQLKYTPEFQIYNRIEHEFAMQLNAKQISPSYVISQWPKGGEVTAGLAEVSK